MKPHWAAAILGIISIGGSCATAAGTDAVWVDDALPAGAVGGSAGGDSWNWISANPTPYAGTLAHQSAVAKNKFHEHYFSGATATLAVGTNDVLFTYVYLDPANPPTEVMLSWYDGSNWEHRAYWGANKIAQGTNNTASRYPMGALPATGQWVRLNVPAANVGLAGQTISGMRFMLFSGRATWDDSGNAVASTTPSTSPAAAPVFTPAGGNYTSAQSVTMTSATTGASIRYTLDGSVPTATSGTLYSTPITISATTTVSAVAYATGYNTSSVTSAAYTISAPTAAAPTFSPSGGSYTSTQNVTLSSATSGASIRYTTDGSTPTSTTGTLYSGPIAIGATATLNAVAYASGFTTSPVASAAYTINTSSSTTSTDFVWIEDALPSGASASTSGGDSWSWVNSNPTPYSGTLAHQTIVASGIHEQSFNFASTAMPVHTGDSLYTYVYIDPANVPSEIMLSWCDGSSWEHRAYWGSNLITYGTNGTSSRYYVGAIPAAGQWVRLAVPASAVALEGTNVVGMGFSLYNGRVTWDHTGTSGTTTSSTTTAQVATPSFTPAGGNYSSSQSVTIATVTAGASIRYTTDGSMPTATTGTLYAGPITISGSTPLNAVAYETGYANSSVASATYSITTQAAAPTFSPAPGSYTSTQGVTIASSTTGAAIYYTTNGTTPSATNGTLYAGPVSVGAGSTTLQAVAIAAGYANSTVTSGAYTVTTSSSSGGSPSPTATVTAENATLTLPNVGDHQLTIVNSTVLELERINTKQPDPGVVDSWNFIDASNNFVAPATSEFVVTVNGQTVGVTAVGFKRRARYAPLLVRDLRIDNFLYLRLASAVPTGATVVVTNPDGTLWPAAMQFTSVSDPLRYSPAIHVNQEGYVPAFSKKAMVGYYLGNLGEMNASGLSSFSLVNAATGVTVFQGSLTSRPDVGYSYSPLPYQQVLMADFSSFTTPGEYQLVVPGLGASLPFLIDEGIAMGFARTYALGIYHQRCGTTNALPFTRFVHDACHTAAASVPSPQSSFSFTWSCIASKNSDYLSTDPTDVGPQLNGETAQLYPFVRTGTVDVSGGHHDAGDYSKYTINSAQLVHELMFAVDAIPGVAALDNLGLPESGDGISDVMQEAKWEADYIAKLQDTDGGFYFIVYPQNREYEMNVLPDHGDPQVVWPKNTSATAAAVAALAQCASSPLFKQTYPAAAQAYLQKAQLGWQFLMNAIAKFGKDGAYQKITFYGDRWIHNDEIAWAACELYLATGDTTYQQQLFSWFPNPADSNTFLWGWWRMSESWGNAIRSYAFAARTGRLATSQLDSTYLTACQNQVIAAGDDALTWSNQHAYASSFPTATKQVQSAGWYFSLNQASDMAVAYQLNPKAAYLDALVGNMNYEGGCNPLNVTYLTGLGLKRQREIVNQYALNDRRVLPPDGVPLGNIQSSYDWLTNYSSSSGNELAKLNFPADGSTMIYPFYDRWADTWNTTTEFITVNQARSFLALSVLATQTAAKSTAWTGSTAVQIVVPTTTVPLNSPVTLSFTAAGLDLTNARIVWEARDQNPDFGSTYTISPKNNGTQWVEVEIEWPDGRRAFATGSFWADSPTVVWFDDALPAGAQTSATGGDAWNWVAANPTPYSGSLADQTIVGTGIHEQAFTNGTPLVVSTGNIMFVYVYIDPANVPSEIMLNWNDGSSWEHRAYWGSNLIQYGTNGTASRYAAGALPAAGGWVRLAVPASAVGLEGKSVSGMCFSLYGGRATFDAAGKSSP